MEIKARNKLLWAFVLSMVFLTYLLSKVDWKHFTAISDRFVVKYALIAFVIFAGINLIRTSRFHRLDHTGNRLRRWWIVNQLYNFMTASFPGGAGEAATAYVLRRFFMFDIADALRMLVLTRLMDLAAVSTVFFIAAVQMSEHTIYRNQAILFSGLLCIASSIALVPAIEQFALRMLQRLPDRSKIIGKLSAKFSELIRISEEPKKDPSIFVSLFQSIIMMAGVAMSLHLLLMSFGVNLSLVQSFYCFGVYAVFQIIPIQGLAGIGTQAAWWSLALNVSGYHGMDSIAIGFVLHGIFYLFIACLGIPSVVIWLVERKAA